MYRWTTRPTEEAPVEILRAHGYDLIADGLSDVIDAPDEQRDGVYGTAKQMARCPRSRSVEPWITETGGPASRRHFDPEKFVRNGGTLYSLSKEGKGSAGGLVAALTVAVVEAAEAYAVDQGGRLKVPLLAVLDEAANVCRWRDLPDLYSHFGSRGIVLMTILQSYSQGVEVSGERGMKKLWSSANVKVYGGGVSEVAFLDDLSKLVGYDKLTRSTSSKAGAGGVFGSSGVTTSRQLQRDLIMEVDDLAALPKGRAIVLSSGNRATIGETMPWMTGPHADAIRDSIKAHDPEAQKTLREADEELLRVQEDLATLSGMQEVSR
ncbi:type IV secretory system conjugative DNA transfer family protein [Nocardioides sp.]|uniref:type IV secretory system conjugative DNA transfer family protein n=1 Tax=Nocardioides sp. TaxID=35761 RepID=UPI002BAF7D45|nr:TraM recognition domain-containing protein [Nocardioides sp.]HXH78992.1 TraM recognition domain-containing protein [Nocardioides sp.]